MKEAHKKANRRKTLMEQELKNLKGEKMRMYEEYAAGTLPLDTYKQKKQECDRRISEVQEQIEQSKAEESAESVVPGTVRAAAEQAENFLNGTRLTAGMVSAFIENVFVHALTHKDSVWATLPLEIIGAFRNMIRSFWWNREERSIVKKAFPAC